MKTFEVPVWFEVQAEDQEQAWQKIERMMNDNLPVDMYNQNVHGWLVNEPVEINEED